jgi:hypothetical protein
LRRIRLSEVAGERCGPESNLRLVVAFAKNYRNPGGRILSWRVVVAKTRLPEPEGGRARPT